jgi:hypothetical protein
MWSEIHRIWVKWVNWHPSSRTAWTIVVTLGVPLAVLLTVVLWPSGTPSSDLASPIRYPKVTIPATTTAPGAGNSSTASPGSSDTATTGSGPLGNTGTTGSGPLGGILGTGASGTGSSGGSSSTTTPAGGGLTAAPSGESNTISGGVANPPGTVQSVLVTSDPTYAVIEYGGTSPTNVLLHQSGSGWQVLGEGSPQIACVPGLPSDVQSSLSAMMQFCG